MPKSTSQRINIIVPNNLLTQIDNVAKADYSLRSDVIRRALTEYIRKPENIEKMAKAYTGRDYALERFLSETSATIRTTKQD